jgi:hypothetical protein
MVFFGNRTGEPSLVTISVAMLVRGVYNKMNKGREIVDFRYLTDIYNGYNSIC